MVDEEQNQPINVSSKRLKVEETLEENEEEEDRISALPDCIILQILSLLPSTEDAIRTGKLSKRWKCLWTSIPTLIFRQKSVMYSDNPITSDFVSFVNRTLNQCRHSKLSNFEVVVQYGIPLESQVNNWIHYATSRYVEVLNLTFLNLYSEDEHLLEEQFFNNSCCTDLRLKGFIFNPNGAISWKMLRTLCISYANLDEDLIENILLGSPVLETLELNSCYGYRRLDISSKSVKNLVVYGYVNPTNDDLADVIEINAPNILSLKVRSELVLWKFLLVDVSSLVEAELDYIKLGYCETTRIKANEKMLKGLIQSLHHVKEFKVGKYCFMVLSRLEAKGFPFPPNMKFPEVTSP